MYGKIMHKRLPFSPSRLSKINITFSEQSTKLATKVVPFNIVLFTNSLRVIKTDEI